MMSISPIVIVVPLKLQDKLDIDASPKLESSLSSSSNEMEAFGEFEDEEGKPIVVEGVLVEIEVTFALA